MYNIFKFKILEYKCPNYSFKYYCQNIYTVRKLCMTISGYCLELYDKEFKL